MRIGLLLLVAAFGGTAGFLVGLGLGQPIWSAAGGNCFDLGLLGAIIALLGWAHGRAA